MPVAFRASRKRTCAWPGASSGSAVGCMPLLAAACIAVLATACAAQQTWETPSLLDDQASSILSDGFIYIPVAVGPLGCVLYSVEIPGGPTHRSP